MPRSIFQQKAPRGIKKMRILGIDEISLRKEHKQYALVISDIEKRCVIEVLENRRKDTLESRLKELSKEEGKTIKFVSTNM
jgi:transposase